MLPLWEGSGGFLIRVRVFCILEERNSKNSLAAVLTLLEKDKVGCLSSLNTDVLIRKSCDRCLGYLGKISKMIKLTNMPVKVADRSRNLETMVDASWYWWWD